MRLHSNWLSAYLKYCQHSEAPDKFHFWTGVSVIAGALRRKVWIDQGYFQWTPNFYIVFVAPPGIVSKSTTASIGMRILRKIPDIHFGPDAVTWQSLVQSLAKSTETFSLPNDPDGKMFPMSAITIVSSEFGTFLNPNDRDMVDVLVSLWDGQVGIFEKATKTQGDDRIENPWINIIACTTPAWIAGNFPEYMIGGGFTSRTVFVYAEEKRHLVAYPKEHIPANFEVQGQELLRDLEVIATQMAGEYIITPEALKWGVQWYEEHYEKRPAHLDNARFGGYIARKQTHIHKLAMVLAAAESNELKLHKHHLEMSAEYVDELELDMPKVFANIGRTPLADLSEELKHYVIRKSKVEIHDLFKRFESRVTDEDFAQMIATAFRTGDFIQRREGNDTLIVYAPRRSSEKAAE